MLAAVYFAYEVESWINRALMVISLVIEAVALVHCLVQRSDAFTAIGTLSKRVWVALLVGALLLTALSTSVVGILGFIALTIAAIYMLDVRPALRDAPDGGPNSW